MRVSGYHGVVGLFIKGDSMARRVALIVLDSFGIREEPDARLWNEGSNTLCACETSFRFTCSPSIPAFSISHITCLQGQIRTYVPVTVLDHTHAMPLETETCRLTLAA